MTAITWLKHNWCKVLLVVILCITPLAVFDVLVYVTFACSTYECYLYINNIPVMICTMGMPLITFGVVGIILTTYYIYMTNIGQQKQFWNNILTVIKLVFSNFLKKPNSEGEEEMFIVLGYEVMLKEMYWLNFLLVEVTLLAFAQFWDEFLLEVSGSCGTDSHLHCYYTNNSTLPYRKLNCLNTSQVEEATSIVCYQYVFNIGQAAASAIGIISTTGLIIYIICIVFLKVLDGPRLSKWFIRFLKGVAVFYVFFFCTALAGLQTTYTPRAPGNIGIAKSLQKVIGMSIMITTSVYFFPVGKFRKSENRDGYEPITNEPEHETV